jgi:hypothetical protein
MRIGWFPAGVYFALKRQVVCCMFYRAHLAPLCPRLIVLIAMIVLLGLATHLILDLGGVPSAPAGSGSDSRQNRFALAESITCDLMGESALPGTPAIARSEPPQYLLIQRTLAQADLPLPPPVRPPEHSSPLP